MPHVIVKMYAGRSDVEKQELANRITTAVTDVLGYDDNAVSVGVEDVAPAAWLNDVYQPDIASKADQLFKRPGYGPLSL